MSHFALSAEHISLSFLLTEMEVSMRTIRNQFRCAISCLTAAVIALSGASALPMTAANAATLTGDCDASGTVTVDDVYVLRDYLAMGTALDAPQAADLNNDSRIDAVDLTLLKRALLYGEPEAESVTVMLYLCGSDLETQAEQATMDMEEMFDAETSAALNVVMATGGAQSWSSDNPYVNADSNYYVTYNADGVKITDCGSIMNMAEADTLSQFISYASTTYPADRYALVLWDHGGGPMYGLCYDENYNQSMSIATLCDAIEDAGVYFDWIGFDCCLMASAEIAYAMRNYADYMIASEESESGLGWNYTRFLTTLAEDPAIDTQELAKIIIADMISDNRRYQMEATLSLYDLDEAENVIHALYDYVDDIYALYKEKGLAQITAARAKAQDFGEGEYDLVDLVHLASLLPTEHSEALCTAIDAMVLEKQTYRMDNANGVSAWFFENYPNEAIYLSYTLAYYGIDTTYIAQLKEMAQAAENANAASVEGNVPAHDDVLITTFAQWFASIH